MSFKSDINQFSRKIAANTEEVFIGTSLAMYASIIKRTPVDKGRLVANWQVDLNKAATGELDGYDKTKTKTLKKGTAQIQKATLVDEIYFTNNLPYAHDIEYGGSPIKSPEGMVRVTLEEFDIEVKKQAKKVQ